MGHDSEPAGEDGSHHSHVGAMPQKLPVSQLGVGLEPVTLGWEKNKGITIQSQEQPGLGQGRGLGHSHLGSTGLAEAWRNAGSVVKLTS